MLLAQSGLTGISHFYSLSNQLVYTLAFKVKILFLLLGFIMDNFKYSIIMCSEVSGDREVQRTMLELLNQLDGFSSDDSIKVC